MSTLNNPPQIDVTPSAQLPVSTERQRQIIDGINAALRRHPRQGFCFIGRPGVGKTFLMKAIRDAVKARFTSNKHNRFGFISDVITLSEWQSGMVLKVNGGYSRVADRVSVEAIRAVQYTNENEWEWLRSTSTPDEFAHVKAAKFAFNTVHLFFDEFDSQPTLSNFAQSNLQTLTNAIYENAPRLVPGNEQDFVQLVVAMNKSFEQFTESYGTHVARRIGEMCVTVNFNETAPPIKSPVPATPGMMPAATELDVAIEGMV
jgi:hypothetical protein